MWWQISISRSIETQWIAQQSSNAIAHGAEAEISNMLACVFVCADRVCVLALVRRLGASVLRPTDVDLPMMHQHHDCARLVMPQPLIS